MDCKNIATFLFTLSATIAGVLIPSALAWEEGTGLPLEIQIMESDKICTRAEDCVPIATRCDVPCWSTFINKQYERKYLQLLQKTCNNAVMQEVACGPVPPPQCLNNRCTYGVSKTSSEVPSNSPSPLHHVSVSTEKRRYTSGDVVTANHQRAE